MQNPPPYQPVAPESNVAVDEARAKTALGLDANLGAALGYPVGILAIIIFVMEKTNRFARFHALQSLLFHVVMVVLFIVFGIVLGILAAILGMISNSLGVIVGLLIWLIFMGLGLAYIGALIFCAIKAYGGANFKLPIAGNMAEKILNK
jgi:uncharacterized membrane protein